jgi:hypothetical protein
LLASNKIRKTGFNPVSSFYLSAQEFRIRIIGVDAGKNTLYCQELSGIESVIVFFRRGINTMFAIWNEKLCAWQHSKTGEIISLQSLIVAG